MARAAAMILLSLPAACTPAPQDVRLVDVPGAAPAGSASAVAPATELPARLAFQRSKCVLEGAGPRVQLGLSASGATYASVAAASFRVALPAPGAGGALVEVDLPNARFEGLSSFASLPITARDAFDGYAMARVPYGAQPGVVRSVEALGGERFAVELAAPAGLSIVDRASLRVVASCDQLALLSGDPGGVPSSATESRATLAATTPLARTPGGPPVALVTPRTDCDGAVVAVERRGAQALVRVHYDQLVVFGWVDQRALGAPPRQQPLDPCEFGMVGLLSTTMEPPPPGARYTCEAAMPFFAEVAGRVARTGASDGRVCLRRTPGAAPSGLAPVALEGRLGAELALADGARLLVAEDDLGRCAQEEPAEDGTPASRACD